MTTTKRRLNKRERERREAKRHLAEHLRPGTTVYTVLRHVSRSGMMRRLDVYTFETNADGGIRKLYLTYWAAKVLGYSMNDVGMRVDGCGMDMGFHVVHSLSYAIHGMRIHGRHYCGPDAAEASEHGRPFAPGTQAFRTGYSLNHEWI